MNTILIIIAFLSGTALSFGLLSFRFNQKQKENEHLSAEQINKLEAEKLFFLKQEEDLNRQVHNLSSDFKELNANYLDLHGAYSSLETTYQGQKESINNLNIRNRSLEEQLKELNYLLQVNQKSLNEANNAVLLKNNELLFNEQKLTTQKEQVKELQDSFYTKFQQLASEILENKSQRFTELNKTNIQELLTPLQEKLKTFESRIELTHLEETKQRSALGQEIRSLMELNNQISKEANNLANALKNNVKSMGNWGELILESILENSGLEKDREYRVQPSFTNADGQLRQPDVVIYFPDNRCVIIDSKVSLVAYERFVSTEDSLIQEVEMKNHITSIKQHIDTLSAKNYPALYQLEDFSLDFVLMFMPIEPAYLLAMQKEHALWNYAYQKKIILISPTNLIAVLKMISSLWKQEYQNRNVLEIARLSGALYDKFCGFLKDFETIGNALGSAQKNYDDAINKLSSGKGNILNTAEKVRKLGAKSSKTIPEKWLVEDSEEELLLNEE